MESANASIKHSLASVVDFSVNDVINKGFPYWTSHFAFRSPYYTHCVPLDGENEVRSPVGKPIEIDKVIGFRLDIFSLLHGIADIVGWS